MMTIQEQVEENKHSSQFFCWLCRGPITAVAIPITPATTTHECNCHITFQDHDFDIEVTNEKAARERKREMDLQRLS